MDGRSLRSTVSRSSHAIWDAPAGRDPVALLRDIFATLEPDLVPLRIERMSASPFAFYRGSAALMASDLARTPSTGIVTQISGDAHVANFGGYASAERRLVFDVNDFDETVRGPWEWDVKRLATSLILAGREREHRARACETAAYAAVASYRDRIAEYAAMPVVDVWYASIDLSGAVRSALDGRSRRTWLRTAESAQRNTDLALLPRITHQVGEDLQFIDDPPGLVRMTASGDVALANAILDAYRAGLRPDARLLLERFALADVARKVVGVGSVGTWCALLLMLDASGYPLLLQVKEARASALEPYVGPQRVCSHGERVVDGQRLMQASSDALLGWAAVGERCVYVRQYRNMKATPDRFLLRDDELQDYAAHCGWALARAHARAGDPRTIADYVGRGSRFVDAITTFARAYADQTDRDFEAFRAAFSAPPPDSRPATLPTPSPEHAPT
ncbi:MAG TPA: DUF2252 domain-containing protein [Candidatus Elarobacter sp.]|jgi:uncharacterized protein (DUF2252 family)|nr:DUF2252 domain-containing protein [Candidatus Elarobacter sp.]